MEGIVMSHQMGFNIAGLKFNYQDVSNIGVAGTDISLNNGDYIRCSIDTTGSYGLINLLNPTNIRVGQLCIIHYNQLTELSTYKPLIINARITSGYNTFTYQTKRIGLLPGESILLVQKTNNDTIPYWSLVGLGINNIIASYFNIPIDDCWFNIGTAGTTVTTVYEDMTTISPYNVNSETTGQNTEIWYPIYMSSNVAYKVYLIGQLGTDKGQVVIYEGENAINIASNVDFYDAVSTSYSTIEATSTGNYTPLYCGNHIIRIKVTDKNAASSDYKTKLAHIKILPQVNIYT
jgi:hypothetical protein